MNLETERRRDELLELLWRLNEFYTLDLPALRQHDTDNQYEQYLREFSQNGMIRMKGEQIELTPKGMSRAEGLVRRHRLAERLLVDVLGKSPAETEESACEFEHLLAPDLVEAICTLLGHPKTCPHGIVIPPGTCCKEARTTVHSMVIPLSELRQNEQTSIAFLNTLDIKQMNRIMAMGLVPGVKLHLLQRYPALMVQLADQTQLAFEESVSQIIHVWQPTRKGG